MSAEAIIRDALASGPLYHRALDVQARWRFSFYDSLIVASALQSGVPHIAE